ncbi:MAG: DinB family protein [Phycisphaerales bacterium]|nr:DinB family protein [Phycisphaerales bacterium]
MTPNRAFLENLKLSRQITEGYLSDLTDADLFIRPVAGMNHIAWQLGHLIAAEHGMASAVGVAAPELPVGFADAHSDATSKSDDRSRFCSKAQYVDLLNRVRAAVETHLEKVPPDQFDQPAPESMRAYAATVGAVYALLAAHELMHAGQWVAVRRALGRAPLF